MSIQSNISSDELKALKKIDPFMYHSIMKKHGGLLHGNGKREVIRQTRVSCEVHPDVIMERMFDEMAASRVESGKDDVREQ